MINKFDGQYAFLSNFYSSPITPWIDNITYPTVEHAFQAMKSFNPSERKMIAAAPTPGKAKSMGRHVELRPDWRTVRTSIMEDALIEKFKDPQLRQKLLSTGDQYLIEGNWWHDNYWGDCYCPNCEHIKGENHLGQLLMKIREEIKNS